MHGDPQKVSIIGAGKVGTAIAVLLARAGREIAAVSSRRQTHADAAAALTGAPATLNAVEAASVGNLIFITTPDDAVEPLCREIAAGGGFAPGDVVFHVSGALSTQVLDAAREAGAHVGSIHPMQSFADVDGAIEQLHGAVFGVTAEGKAAHVALQIVDALGGEAVPVADEQKVLYHAAACIISNYLVALADYAEDLFATVGVTPEAARRAYAPLLHGTAKNLARWGPTDALTGPIVRGDVDTVRAHLAAMTEAGLDTSLYRLLGRRTVAIAQRRGTLPERVVQSLLALLGDGPDASFAARGCGLRKDKERSNEAARPAAGDS